MNWPIPCLHALLMRPQRITAPTGWVEHIPFMAWLIAISKPKLWVELGTHSGNSYLAACQSVQEHQLSTVCYAVDTWQGDQHSGNYAEEVFQSLEKYHREHYAQFSNLLRMTFDEAVNYFNAQSIDILHIDGLHTYEAVKHDFVTWLPKVSPQGVVLFHDIAVRENDFGVWKLWEELKTHYLSFEFHHSHGLGVLFLGDSNHPAAQYLLANTESETVCELQRLFSTLGAGLKYQYESLEKDGALQRQQQDIANLWQGITERDEGIKQYQATLANREQHIGELDQAYKQLSQAWQSGRQLLQQLIHLWLHRR